MDVMDKVLDFEARTLTWGVAATGAEADRVTGEEMAKVRAEHSRGGFLMANPDTLKRYEATFREQYDQQLRESGLQLAAERDALAAELRAEIEAQKTLRPAWKGQASYSDRLQAQILDELQQARITQTLRGRSRSYVLDRLARMTDEADNVETRLLEDAVLSNDLDRLGIVTDPDVDAIVIPKLRQAVETRRQQRVPHALLDAEAKLAKVFSFGHEMTMRHLRSGMGVATRPMTVA